MISTWSSLVWSKRAEVGMIATTTPLQIPSPPSCHHSVKEYVNECQWYYQKVYDIVISSQWAPVKLCGKLEKCGLVGLPQPRWATPFDAPSKARGCLWLLVKIIEDRKSADVDWGFWPSWRCGALCLRTRSLQSTRSVRLICGLSSLQQLTWQSQLPGKCFKFRITMEHLGVYEIWKGLCAVVLRSRNFKVTMGTLIEGISKDSPKWHSTSMLGYARHSCLMRDNQMMFVKQLTVHFQSQGGPLPRFVNVPSWLGQRSQPDFRIRFECRASSQSSIINSKQFEALAGVLGLSQSFDWIAMIFLWASNHFRKAGFTMFHPSSPMLHRVQ